MNQYAHKWLVHAGISLLAFTAFLDFTIVNTALPAIQSELAATVLQLQWVMNGYLMMISIMMIIGGKLGDLIGHRQMFLIGAIVFLLASLLAGLAVSPLMLILARFLQGIGAAIIFPMSTTLLPTAFPENERIKALSIYGAVSGLGLALGPVLGGILVSVLSWRYVFLINVPIIALGLLLSMRWLPNAHAKPMKIKLDWIGVILLGSSISSLLLAINFSEILGWMNLMTLVFFAVAVITSILLIKFELKIAEPLLELGFFKNPLFYAGALACGVAGLLSVIALFFNPFYLNLIRQESALVSGMILLIIPVAVTIISPFVGKMIEKWGIIKVAVIAMICTIIACFLHILFQAQSTLILILFAFTQIGVVWAIGNNIGAITAHQTIPKEKIGNAIGTIYTLFNLMGAIGLALATLLFQSSMKKYFFDELNESHTVLSAAEQASFHAVMNNPDKLVQLTHQFQPEMQSKLLKIFSDAFMQGFSDVFIFIAAVVGVLLLTILVWRWFQSRQYQVASLKQKKMVK